MFASERITGLPVTMIAVINLELIVLITILQDWGSSAPIDLALFTEKTLFNPNVL